MALFDTVPLALSKQVADRLSYAYGGDIRARCIEHTLQHNCIRICEMALNLRKDQKRDKQPEAPPPQFYSSAINNIEPIAYYYMLPCNLPSCLPVASVKKRFLFRTLFDIHHFPGLYHVTELLETGVFDNYSEDEDADLSRNFGRCIPKKPKNASNQSKKRSAVPIYQEVADIKLTGMTQSLAEKSANNIKRIIQSNNPTRPRARDPLMRQLNTIAITTAMIEDANSHDDDSTENYSALKSSSALSKPDDKVPLLTINHKQEAARLAESMIPCSVFDAVEQFVRRSDFQRPVTRAKWEEYSVTFLKKCSWGRLRTVLYEQAFIVCNLLGVEAVPDFPDLTILTELISECLFDQGLEIIPEYEPIFHEIVKERVQAALEATPVCLPNLLSTFTREDLQNIMIVTKNHHDIMSRFSASGSKLLFHKWRELTVTDYIIQPSEPTPEATLYSITESKCLGNSRKKEKDFAETTMAGTMQYFLEGTVPECHPLIKEAITNFLDANRADHNIIYDIITRLSEQKPETSHEDSQATAPEQSASSFDAFFRDCNLEEDSLLPKLDNLSENAKTLIADTLSMLGKRAWMQRVCDMYALVTKLGPYLHRTETSGIRVVPLSLTSYFIDYLGAKTSYLVSTEEIPKTDPLYRLTDGWTRYTQQSCNDLWYCPFAIDDRILSHYTQLYHTIIAFTIALAVTEPRVPPRELVYELGFLALFGLERSSTTAHVITGCKYLYSTAVNCLTHTAKNIISDYFQIPNMTFVSGYLARRCLLYMQHYSSLQKSNLSTKSDNSLSESKYDEKLYKCSTRHDEESSRPNHSTHSTPSKARSAISPKAQSVQESSDMRARQRVNAANYDGRSLTTNTRVSKLGTKTQLAKQSRQPSSGRQLNPNPGRFVSQPRDRVALALEDISSSHIADISSAGIHPRTQIGEASGDRPINAPYMEIVSVAASRVSRQDEVGRAEASEDGTSTDFQTRSLFSSKPISARLCLQLLLMSSCINGSLSSVDLLAESTINRKIENELKALRVLTGLCISQSRSLYDSIMSFGFQYVSDFTRPPGQRLYLRECKSEEHIIDAEIRLIKLLQTCRIPYAYSPSVVMAAGQLLFMDISGIRLLGSIAKMTADIVEFSSTDRSVKLQQPCFLRGKLPYSASGGGIMVTTGLEEKKKTLEIRAEDEAYYIKSLLINNTDTASSTVPPALFPGWPTINLSIPTHNTLTFAMTHVRIQENILRDSAIYGRSVQANEAIFSVFTDTDVLNKYIQAGNAELYCKVQRKLASMCPIEDLVALDWRLTSLLYQLSFSDEEFFSGSSNSADLTFKFLPDSETIALSIRAGLFMKLQVETEALANCTTIGMLLTALQEALDNISSTRVITVYFSPELVEHMLLAIMSPKFKADQKLTQRDIINVLGLLDPDNVQVATLQSSDNNDFYETKLSSNIGHGILTKHAESIAELFLMQCPEHYGHDSSVCIPEFINMTTTAQSEVAAIHESASLSSLTESLMPTLFYTMMLPARRFLNSYFDSCALNYMMSEEKLVIFEDGFVDAISTGYITGIEPSRSGSAIRIHTNLDDGQFRWHSSLLHVGLVRLRKYLLDQFFKKVYQLNYTTALRSHAMINQTSRYTCLVMNAQVISSFSAEQLKEFIRLVINKISTYGQILCELASFNPLASSTIVSRAYAEFNGVYYMRGNHLTNILKRIFTMCNTAFQESTLREKMLQVIDLGRSTPAANCNTTGTMGFSDNDVVSAIQQMCSPRENITKLPRAIRRYLYRCLQKKFEQMMFPSRHPIRHYFELEKDTEAISLMPVILGGLPPIELVEMAEHIAVSQNKSVQDAMDGIILVDLLNRAFILRTAVDAFSKYNVGTIYRRFIKLYKLWKQYGTYQSVDIYIGNMSTTDLQSINLAPQLIAGLCEPDVAFKSYSSNDASLRRLTSASASSNPTAYNYEHDAVASESEALTSNPLKSILSDSILDEEILSSLKSRGNNSSFVTISHMVASEDSSKCRNRKQQLEMLSRRYWAQRTSTTIGRVPLGAFFHFLARNSALAVYDGQNMGMSSLVYKLIEDVLDYDV